MNSKIYTLENRNGTKAILTDAGASLMQFFFNGRNVVLGYDSADDYLTGWPPFGMTIGRFANRIGDARFVLNGVTYELDKNDGKNMLHGGFNGWNHRLWDAVQSGNSVTFSLVSEDGDQGMPGRAEASVTYTLEDDDSLHIRYRAASDKDTYFNLTNHSYFNLGGKIEEHSLWMDSDVYADIDDGLIPTGRFNPVDGHMDFRKEKPLDTSYDHCYMIANVNSGKPFAKARCGDISLEATTDLPAVQLFTGEGSSFCLETQFVPDSPNHPEFPRCLFKAGDLFESETVYRFS